MSNSNVQHNLQKTKSCPALSKRDEKWKLNKPKLVRQQAIVSNSYNQLLQLCFSQCKKISSVGNLSKLSA